MVTGVFALGLVTCITSLVRVIKVWKSFEMDGGVQGAGAAEALGIFPRNRYLLQ